MSAADQHRTADQHRMVDGREIALTRPGKELYPADGLTKLDVADYYAAVADVMVPHLRGRPLTLRRFPDGIDGDGFFQKEASDYFPDWIRTVSVPLRTGSGRVRHPVCDDPATLVYLAGQACLEFHVWLSRDSALERPDRMIIDLDPPAGTEVTELRDVARRARRLFESYGLAARVQTTGGRGYHVVAPLDGGVGYGTVRPFVRNLASRLVADDPERLTIEQHKDRRGQRIFLDVNRNAYGQTAIAPYSLRARPGAPAATPLDWGELGRSGPASYGLGNLRQRLARKADPWAGIGEDAARLPDAG